MTEPREARLWMILGFSFVAGGGGLLAANFQNFSRTRVLDAEGLKIGVFCSFAVLAGLAALATWRVLRNMEHPPKDHGRILWHLLARIGTPLGGIIVEYGWAKTLSIPVTYNEKALLFSGGFILMAGLLALMSERIVLHLQDLAEFHAEYAPANRQAPADAKTSPAA